MQLQSTIDAAKLAQQIASGADDEMDAAAAGKRGRSAMDAMAAAEEAALAEQQAAAEAAAPRTALSGFVSAGVIQQGQPDEAAKARAAAEKLASVMANPEEIDIDLDEGAAAGDGVDGDDGGADADETTVVQTKAVPAEVFGSLAAKAQQQQEGDGDGEQPLGALERFKKRRVQ